MRNFLIAITLLLFLTSVAAGAPWRSDTHDVYNALQKPADITIDGELDDDEGWEGVIETVKGTDGKPFCGVEFEDIGAFEEHGDGKWNGADDHETCFAIVWDPEAIYIGLSVTDDEHEHAAGEAWKGDSVQLAFEPSGKRNAGITLFLYNAALDNDAKTLNINNETVGGTGLVDGENVAIVRNESEKETYYEFIFTAKELQIKGDKFTEGYELGIGICVNDGDVNTPGQAGWSGWYPHAIVHNKNSEQTGLVRLTEDTLAVEAANKLTTTWGKIKSTR